MLQSMTVSEMELRHKARIIPSERLVQRPCHVVSAGWRATRLGYRSALCRYTRTHISSQSPLHGVSPLPITRTNISSRASDQISCVNIALLRTRLARDHDSTTPQHSSVRREIRPDPSPPFWTYDNAHYHWKLGGPSHTRTKR